MLLALAYVSLPWWAPTDLIRRRLAEQMSGQLGLDVRIGELTMTWGGGVELRNIEVDSPEGFSGGSDTVMLSAASVRAELSPINYFWRRRIAWMEVERPVLNVEVDAEGNFNINAFNRLKFEAESDRISVRRAVVNVLLAEHKQRLVLGVQDMQLVAGRTTRLGRVTMSAELRQDGSTAPVALSFDTAQDAKPISATAAFNFANLDMAQLNLVKILGLPLRKLAGRCSGSLSLQENEDGQIDHVRLNLTMRRLDLQPLDKRIKLPVVAEAGFRVSASYDPVDGRVELQPFSVRLPGLDMSGTGTLFGEALEGKWQGIRRLEMGGEIRPAQLAAMLTGTSELPGDLDVIGPVRLDVKLDHRENALAFSGTIDASSAEFRHGDRAVKPARRKFRVELNTTLDERTFGLDVRQWRMQLGDNVFTGQGTVRDLRRLFVFDGGGWPIVAWDSLENWQWKGRAELRELDSLASLAPGVQRALRGVGLSGPITGEISIDSREGLVAQGTVNMPKGSSLTLGDRVLKPADQNVKLFGRASGNRKAAGLDDVEFRLAVGSGRVVLDRGRIRFVGSDPKTKTGAYVGVSGDFEASGVEHLLASVRPGGVPGVKAAGSVRGKYVVRLSPEAQRLHLTVSDMSNLDFRAGKLLSKPSGQEASVSLDFISDRRMSQGSQNILRAAWRAQHADLRGQVSFASGADGPRASGSFRAEIRDARWLAKSLPLAATALGKGRLTGAAVLSARGNWSPGRLRGELHCNADSLAYNSNGRKPRRKDAGVPLQFHLAGRLAAGGDSRLAASIEDLKVVLGNSYVQLAGEVDLLAETPKEISLKTWPEVIPRCILQAGGRLAVENTVTDLIPELGEPIRRAGLGGRGEFAASLDASDKGLVVEVRVDADKAEYAAGDEFVKPVGTPAGATVRLEIPVDFSRFRLNDLRANAGDLHVLASGALVPAGSGKSWRIEPGKLHATVWTRQAETLAKILPAIKPYKISGEAIVEAEWTGAAAPYVSFHTKSLTGLWRGKKVKLSGDLMVSGVRRDARGRWTAKGLRTDNLQLRAGKNHVWLVGNVKNINSSPTGSVTLLGRYLDTRDIRSWVAPPVVAITRPAATTKPADDGPDKYAPARRRAEKLIASILPTLRTSDVKFDAKIAHLRLWDSNVLQYYDLRDLKLQASLDRGLVETSYACGLNAGSVRGGLKIDLKEDPPEDQPTNVEIWQDIRDVVARENIQPQLALFFPGNTVYGYFNRRQDVTLPLTDFVASTSDSSMPVYPVGAAKTVTVDGMTQGRAAPKFVTALFPGLNMTSYRYKKMTAFSELHADGGAYSDMIFSGKTYDMYIEGTTDSNKIGRYEIGLILIGTPQTPEWNHFWRQGRLPILKFKARIQDGKMHDVSVSYPWPNESLGVIFLKNNILYRAYLASQGK